MYQEKSGIIARVRCTKKLKCTGGVILAFKEEKEKKCVLLLSLLFGITAINLF
jgi:hypothetical protein